jgi:hypothetical protein
MWHSVRSFFFFGNGENHITINKAIYHNSKISCYALVNDDITFIGLMTSNEVLLCGIDQMKILIKKLSVGECQNGFYNSIESLKFIKADPQSAY